MDQYLTLVLREAVCPPLTSAKCTLGVRLDSLLKNKTNKFIYIFSLYFSVAHTATPSLETGLTQQTFT